MTALPVTVTLLILIAAIGLFGFAIKLYLSNRSLSQKVKDLEAKPPDWTHLSDQLIVAAKQNANQIVTSAQVDALKLTTEANVGKDLFQKDFKEALDKEINQTLISFNQHLQSLQQQIEQSVASNDTRYQKFLEGIEQQIFRTQKQAQDQLTVKVNELMFNFEQNLAASLSKSEQQSIEAVNLEVRSARQLIDSYKSQQLALVDENIVAVLERVMGLVLKEKLTVKDQLDLVYEALERAKLEKFFV